MNNVTVSIIIPAYNSAEYLVETLQSVFDQTHRPIELLIIDDGSTDMTAVLAENWLSEHASSQDFRARLLSQRHLGGAAARNLGLSKATGEWVQFLDADDTLSNNKLGMHLAILGEAEKNVAYCSWRYLYMDKGHLQSGDKRQSQPLASGDDPLKLHLEGWFCPIHAYLWPRSLIESLGGFDTSLAADQDADLLIRGLIAGARLIYTPATEVQYRIHNFGQVSRKQSRSKMRSRLRVVLKVARMLKDDGMLDRYRGSLAIRCDELERSSCLNYRAFSRLCRRTSRQLDPGHCPLVRGGFAYRLSRKIFGLYLSEWLSFQKSRLFKVSM